MNARDSESDRPQSDYVLLPEVTHPQGREKAFDDAFKAMVRCMIEVNDNPTLAYAIDKTDRVVTEANKKLLSEADLAEWEKACEEFEAMSIEDQDAWIHRMLMTYPEMDEVPDLDLYNRLN